MAQYICSNCSYKFKTEKIPRNCPYCSKAGCVREEASAADILSEVDEMISNGEA